MDGNFKIPGEMLGAMKTRSEAEWKLLFKDLVQIKSMQVSGAQTTDELIRIQAAVKGLQELEQFFLSEMRR